MRRYPSSPYAASFSFGPGPVSTALKALIGWAPHGDLTRGLRELLVYEGVVREGVAQ